MEGGIRNDPRLRNSSLSCANLRGSFARDPEKALFTDQTHTGMVVAL